MTWGGGTKDPQTAHQTPDTRHQTAPWGVPTKKRVVLGGGGWWERGPQSRQNTGLANTGVSYHVSPQPLNSLWRAPGKARRRQDSNEECLVFWTEVGGATW